MDTRLIGRLAVAMLISAASAHAVEPGEQDLSQFDLATLMTMDIEVTTATKTAQSIYDIAAPIHVISAQDIRRAGANTIPEALRMAPGVMVGQIDSGKWVVSLRGFAWQGANKALVLLDGRAVYSPLGSNVYWEILDVPVEDIERIEVIRGPGDARWGSHAVNGIINIITKSAADTHGTLLSAVLDTDGSEVFTARHGGAIATNLDYRAYAKYLSQGDFPMDAGVPRLGNREALRAGLRLDGMNRGGDRFVFIGDVQSGRHATLLGLNPSPTTRYEPEEWSALARWERGAPGQLNQQAQLSFDHLSEKIFEKRKTLDFAYQAQLPELRANTLTFGATYKRTADELTAFARVEPVKMTQNIYGVFLHDNIALGAKTKLLLGSQFEHNPFTGWEVQPNMQLLYKPGERRSFWASVSRAVRTPLRTEDGFNVEFPALPGVFLRLTGNHDLQAESVLAWQAGARLTMREELFLDFTAFYNEYEDLVLVQSGALLFEPLPPPGRAILPATFANAASGHTKGAEVALRARPMARWELATSYSLYSQTPLSDPLWFGTFAAVEHQFQIHSSVNIAAHLEWNLDFYYTGELTMGDVPEYYKLDTQLAFTLWKGCRLAVGVKNALDTRHREAGPNTADTAAWIPRTAYLKVLQQF